MGVGSKLLFGGSVVTMGAGILPSVADKLGKDNAVNKALNTASEKVADLSTTAMGKVGLDFGKAGNSIALAAVAAAALAGGAYLLRDKEEEEISVPQIPGSGNGRGGRGQ